MEEILLQYLYQHKTLALGPIGELKLEYAPAKLSTADSLLQPKENIISHIYGNTHHNIDKTVNWISKQLKIGYDEALQKLTQFEQNIQSKIKKGEPFYWTNLGTFSNNYLGVVYFSPLTNSIATGQPIYVAPPPQPNIAIEPLEQINNPETVASEDIIEEDTEIKAPSIINWRLLIGVSIILLGLILLYYYKGNSFNNFQYKQKLNPAIATPTYQDGNNE